MDGDDLVEWFKFIMFVLMIWLMFQYYMKGGIPYEYNNGHSGYSLSSNSGSISVSGCPIEYQDRRDEDSDTELSESGREE